MRNRPDNWSTKRLNKTTWTGLSAASMYFWSVSLVYQSPVHVVLVSLLVDQLSGLFLIFFGRPKKMRKRPDNWSTKRLTKTTWTGLWYTKETDQKYMDAADSPVHVVLFSLLVDQLSGLFLIFFGRPKKNLSSIRSYLFTLLNFLSSLFWKCGFGQSLGRPIVRSISHFLKKTGQKFQESEQKRSKILFWLTKIKWLIDRTIGRPRDWPKPHGRDYNHLNVVHGKRG